MPTRLPDSAACLGCGYLLRGLPENVCPECGRGFDPDDLSTYRLPPAVTVWREFWVGPPGWLHTALVLLVTLALLVGRSRAEAVLDAIPLWLPCFLTFTVAPILVIVYLVRVAACHTDRRRLRLGHWERPPAPKWRWWVMPMCIALVLSGFVVNWPLQLRFAISRPALEAEAQVLLAGKAASGYTRHNRYIGLYYVEHVDACGAPPRVYFCTGSSFIDPVGFVFSPGAPGGTDAGLPTGWYIYED